MMWEALKQGVIDNRIDLAFLPEMESQLFYEGSAAPMKLVQFAVLLGLATVIATFGVTSSSTATVIGAMIVSPLMTPIMASSAALTMGAGERATRSLTLVALAVAGVIALAALLSIPIPAAAIGFDTNSEITSRVSPGLAALLVALASGAAGAFATMRADISNSLPGVAIAISLVPPLCVTGMSLAKRQWTDASGSLLLFTTNFVAILLAGGLVFTLGGLARIAISDTRTRRRAFLVVIGSTLLLAVLLTATTVTVVKAAIDSANAQTTVTQWLRGAQYSTAQIMVNPSNVTVTLAGAGDLPPLEPLALELSRILGRPVSVDLKVVREQVTSVPAP
jgi:uncharacterized hydrophobic protein (TIGR00271 family)